MRNKLIVFMVCCILSLTIFGCAEDASSSNGDSNSIVDATSDTGGDTTNLTSCVLGTSQLGGCNL